MIFTLKIRENKGKSDFLKIASNSKKCPNKLLWNLMTIKNLYSEVNYLIYFLRKSKISNFLKNLNVEKFIKIFEALQKKFQTSWNNFTFIHIDVKFDEDFEFVLSFKMLSQESCLKIHFLKVRFLPNYEIFVFLLAPPRI